MNIKKKKTFYRLKNLIFELVVTDKSINLYLNSARDKKNHIQIDHLVSITDVNFNSRSIFDAYQLAESKRSIRTKIWLKHEPSRPQISRKIKRQESRERKIIVLSPHPAVSIRDCTRVRARAHRWPASPSSPLERQHRANLTSAFSPARERRWWGGFVSLSAAAAAAAWRHVIRVNTK